MIDIDRSLVLTEIELVEQYAKLSGKWVVHFRADGPRKYPEESDKVWQFYENTCDDNVRYMLMQEGEIYCKFESEEQAYDCIHRWFPDENLLIDEEYDLGPEYYIYAYGANPLGVGFVHN